MGASSSGPAVSRVEATAEEGGQVKEDGWCFRVDAAEEEEATVAKVDGAQWPPDGPVGQWE